MYTEVRLLGLDNYIKTIVIESVDPAVIEFTVNYYKSIGWKVISVKCF